ncbi:MAG: PfkB family carbohydrate kinase [Opitutus sp.]
MSAAPQIYTLTGNLLAERTLEFATWAPGKTQRASNETFQVGGKGINVSKMLKRLNVATTALCFTGGAAGAECEAWLRDRSLPFRAFPTDQSTRGGTVIRAANQPETTFLGVDRAPSAPALAACAEFLDQQSDGNILALCGSFPGWNNSTFDPMRGAIERWSRRGVLVVDTYGPPLAWVCALRVALVKINATEFRSLLGDVDSVASGLASVPAKWAVQRWVVSDGPGIVAYRDTGDSKPATMTPPIVTEVSATGSGDVLLACLIDSMFLKNAPLRVALERALPIAAANAAHPGVAEFPDPAGLLS